MTDQQHTPFNKWVGALKRPDSKFVGAFGGDAQTKWQPVKCEELVDVYLRTNEGDLAELRQQINELSPGGEVYVNKSKWDAMMDT